MYVGHLAEGGRQPHPPGLHPQGAWRLLAGVAAPAVAGELWQPPHRAAVDHGVPHQPRHCAQTHCAMQIL